MFASYNPFADRHDVLRDTLRQAAARLRAARALRTKRAQVRFELEQYSDRDLSDLGLGRGDIEGVVAGIRTRTA